MAGQVDFSKLSGRVAFVTGAASGIGHALASELWRQGMRVVLADCSAEGLKTALAAFDGHVDRVLTVELDVTDRAAFARAKDAALERFGHVDLLANIAGVGGGAAIEQADFNDWDWVLGINLGGVINGVVTFLPELKRRPEGAAIVTMGSILSTFPQPGPAGPYGVTKAAVLALSDSLRWSLKDAAIQVTTICPGYVDTAIARSEDLRPDRYPVTSPRNPEHQAFFERILKDAGMSPDEVARLAIEGIKAGRPYVMTHPEFKGAAEAYKTAVLAGYGEGETNDPGRRAAGVEMEALMRSLVD